MKYTFEKPANSPMQGAHPDYKRNLENAKTFVENTQKSLLNGMEVQIADTHNLKQSVLRISWKPPKSHCASTFATPINLHQPTRDYNTQIEKVFNVYMGVVKDQQKKANEEFSFLTADMKV